MSSGGNLGGPNLGRLSSIFMAVMMVVGTISIVSPFWVSVVNAPPSAVLDVTFHDMTPDTNTFPGDSNLTMISLEMTASGTPSSRDVLVTSIEFILGGTIATGEVASVALWDEVTPDGLQEFYECELARVDSLGPTFTLPVSGTLKECTGAPGSDYVVHDAETRYILVLLSVDVTADVGDTINLSIDAINADGTVNGGTGTTRTIEVLSVLFSDDMESGQGGWTFTGGDEGGQHPNGLWHMSSGEEDCYNNMGDQKFYHSYDTSWWYGWRHEYSFDPGKWICSYYTWFGDELNSTRNWGELRTPEIDATRSSSLFVSFWHLIHGELDTPLYKIDNGELWLYDIDLSQWHKLNPDTYDNSESSWWKESIDISSWAGKNIQLEFRFDTLDKINNVFMGWFVDDVVLYGETTVLHDLAVNNLDVPPWVSADPILVSFSVINIGLSGESDIKTNLTENGTVVNQTMIPFLSPGTSVFVGLGWDPPAAGTYELCVEVTPVAGETYTSNNRLCRFVQVAGAIPAPPLNPNAVLSGPNHEDVRITWDLSEDDGDPFVGVYQYTIYRSDNYDPDRIGYVLHDTVPNGTTEYIDVSAGEGNPSNSFYLVCAADIVGHLGCNWTQAGKFTRPLSSGLNLVSIPLIQWDESVTTVLQTVEFEEVWTYDSSNMRWIWHMGYKPYLGDLSRIEQTMGLWIDVAEDSNLTVAGIVPDATDIRLHAGWNLVGFPSFDSSYTVGDLRVEVFATGIEGFDLSASPYYLRKMADGDVLQAGCGYWVRVETETVWTMVNQ